MAKSQKNEELIQMAKSLNNIPWCDDYEKMISGMLYNSTAKELEAGRFRARKWCHQYNHSFPHDDPDATLESLARDRLIKLRELLGVVGEEAYIEPPFTVDYGCNIKLGNRFYANFNMTIVDCAFVTIGDRTMIGPNSSIFAATHEISVQSRRDNIEYGLPVTIGNDCWIGGHVVIIGPVTIGHGVTVAAGSVVTKDIPSWSVAVGVPARVVKKVEPLEDISEPEVGFSGKDRMG